MQVTLSSLRFSSSSFADCGVVKRNTITCPEFVPAHNVGEVVVGLAIKVSANCKHRTIDPCPSSDPALASIALSTGLASGESDLGSSLLIGSVVVVVFLFLLRCERPLRSLRKDSLSDFFNDFRLDMGLSSALAMS